MVKLIDAPGQSVDAGPVGVTVIVAVTGVLPLLTAINDGILPLPLAASPMDGVLLVHVNVDPATELLKTIGKTTTPLHTCWLAG